MNRFFIEAGNLNENIIRLTEKDDIKHLTKVLRAEIGDEYEICLSNEDVYIAEVEEIGSDEVLFKISSKLETAFESNVKITLFQGIPKSDKMDLIVQKNTELGVCDFYPVAMARSVAKINDKKAEAKKVDRWSKISNEAAKQSKRTALPNVHESITLKQAISMFEEFDVVLVPYEKEDSVGIKTALKSLPNATKVAIVIGPEGGFDESEIDLISENGGKSVTLGPRILRTETAGMCAVSVVQYELGDLGERK